MNLKNIFNGAAANDNAPDLDQQLLRACESGELEKVRSLLKQGANIDARHSVSQDTPLITAAREGYLDIVKCLLSRKKKPDVDACNSMGQTALHVAVKADETGVALALVAAGVLPDLTDRWLCTGLMYAAQNNNAEVIAALHGAGADMNLPNDNGASPLIHATKFGHAEAVEKLLACNADANARDDAGRTAVMHAANAGNEELVEIFIARNVHLELTDKEGSNAASLARGRGKDAVAGRIEQALRERYEIFHAGTAQKIAPMKPFSFRDGGGKP